MCVGSTTHLEKAAFSGSSSEHTDILILIQTLPPVPARKPSTAAHCVTLSGLGMICSASAKSHFLISAQFLPNPDLLSAAFQDGRNAINASPLGSSVSDSRFCRNSCSCSPYQVPPVGSKENNPRNTPKMQSGGSETGES